MNDQKLSTHLITDVHDILCICCIYLVNVDRCVVCYMLIVLHVLFGAMSTSLCVTLLVFADVGLLVVDYVCVCVGLLVAYLCGPACYALVIVLCLYA